MDLWAMFCFVFVILVQKFNFVPVSALSTSSPEEKFIPTFIQTKEYEVLTGIIPETGESRIIGGSDARPGEFPWQVSLQAIFGGSLLHFCGGTLVSPTRVITAAHCVGSEIERAVIVAGARNISNKAESTQQTVRIESVVPHENFTIGYSNDIAIIKLATPFNFTGFIQPLRLAPSGLDPVGKNVVNTGWGIKRQFPIPQIPPIEPDILQKVNLTIWPQRDCETAYPENSVFPKVDPGMVCAGHEEAEKKGACFGDSGGPLIVYGDGTGGENTGPFLFGIVSWGNPNCGQRKYPTVYTRVNYYLDWIESHIN